MIIILISVFIAVMDVLIAVKSFEKKQKEGFYLGFASLLAAVVDISYLISILVENPMLYSCLTSVYFISIDIMLNFLVHFVFAFAKLPRKTIHRSIFLLSKLYMVFDILLIGSNPWTKVCVEYIPRETILAKYTYAMKLPYYCHLAYTYLLLAYVFWILIYKSCRAAREYRKPYLVDVFLYAVCHIAQCGFSVYGQLLADQPAGYFYLVLQPGRFLPVLELLYLLSKGDAPVLQEQHFR